jgi:hypothetical protein
MTNSPSSTGLALKLVGGPAAAVPIGGGKASGANSVTRPMLQLERKVDLTKVQSVAGRLRCRQIGGEALGSNSQEANSCLRAYSVRYET